MDPKIYRPKTEDIPTSPGVYRFFDTDDSIIYVGKAKNLRSRLNTYFANPDGLHPRTRAMVYSAQRVDCTIVGSELEALQLEYMWIKQYDPKFNVIFRDDKTYPYLAVTVKDSVPSVKIVRGERRKGIRYFGPYPHARSIKDTVEILLKVFPVRTCSEGVFRKAKNSGRPCLLGYIERCSAPCVGKISLSEHSKLVKDFCDFMAGKAQDFIEPLKLEMNIASANLDYENAAKFRDNIFALEKALEKSTIVFDDSVNVDVFSIISEDLEAAITVFHVRSGRIRGQRSWIVEKIEDSEPKDMLADLLQKFYGDLADSMRDFLDIPQEIWVSEIGDNFESLGLWLSEISNHRVVVKNPQRGSKRTFLDTVYKNAANALRLHKNSRSGDLVARSQALNELQMALNIDFPLLRMECFDISHTQGTNVVGSMVVFEDGVPKNSQYRRFIVSEAGSRDDTTAMYEVLMRRFKHYLDSKNGVLSDDKFSYYPSLIVVDGGKPQVNVAYKALSDLGITNIFICGLAKRLEEIWVYGEDIPVILPRNSQSLFLLQRLRDEAHRFAINFHRKKRSQAMLHSVLEDIPGVGVEKQRLLLEHFGSVKKIKAASVLELQQVPSIGVVLAQHIFDFFNPKAEFISGVDLETGEMYD